MGANFKQKAINTRERLNALQSHHHDGQYEAKGAVIGKNLLINANKSVSQRGDYSGGVAVNGGTISVYYHDRYKLTVIDVNTNFTLIDRKTRLTATSNGNPGTNFVKVGQSIEDYTSLIGKTITYSVVVNSSVDFAFRITDGAGIHEEVFSSTNGEDVIVSQTINVDASTVSLTVEVLMADFDIVIDDYLETGNEQLELGSEFTGFEIVPLAINLLNCQRYWRPLTSDDAFGSVGIFVAVSTTTMRCQIKITPMRTAQPVVENADVSLARLGDLNGAVTANTLATSVNDDATNGILVLNLTGTSFVAGDTTVVRKNSVTTIIGLSSEI